MSGTNCTVEDMVSLQDFLRQKAGDKLESEMIAPIVSYREDINPDAADGDAWLKNRTSYIWKVGVLSIADGNKRDWGYLLIGHQRMPDAECEFIGELYWRDGENDDPGKCLKRYVRCAEMADVLFED